LAFIPYFKEKDNYGRTYKFYRRVIILRQGRVYIRTSHVMKERLRTKINSYISNISFIDLLDWTYAWSCCCIFDLRVRLQT